MQQKIDSDRLAGYRPGVGMLLIHNGHVMIVSKKNTLLSFFENSQNNLLFDKKSKWQFAWDIPQGGIESGETCVQAFAREFFEEIGREWFDCVEGEPIPIERFQSNFPFEKEGIRWCGKTYYYYAIEIKHLPGDYLDDVYGTRLDEGPFSYAIEEFDRAFFATYQEAQERIMLSQGGKKGKILLTALNRLKEKKLIF